MEHNEVYISSNSTNNHTWNGTLVNMDALHLLIYPCPCVGEDGGCLKPCRAEVCASFHVVSYVLTNVQSVKVFMTRSKVSCVPKGKMRRSLDTRGDWCAFKIYNSLVTLITNSEFDSCFAVCCVYKSTSKLVVSYLQNMKIHNPNEPQKMCGQG